MAFLSKLPWPSYISSVYNYLADPLETLFTHLHPSKGQALNHTNKH
jgi:hypothetical protein